MIWIAKYVNALLVSFGARQHNSDNPHSSFEVKNGHLLRHVADKDIINKNLRGANVNARRCGYIDL